jgi:hypothetical protein
MNITEFISDAISYGGEAASDAGNETAQAIRWINAALVNRHAEVCNLSNKWAETTGTVASNGLTVSLPSDWDWIAPIEIYTDSDYQNEYIYFCVFAGEIRLDTKETVGKTLYLRYREAPSVYTSVSDTLVEAANPRLHSILRDEFLSIFLATDNDLESSSAEAAMKIKSDINS